MLLASQRTASETVRRDLALCYTDYRLKELWHVNAGENIQGTSLGVPGC